MADEQTSSGKIEAAGVEKAEEKLTDKNTVTITDSGPCRKKVAIEIPEETVK